MSIRTIMLAIAIGFASCSAFADCQGNACNDIRFSFEGGCYLTKNAGSRTVKVELGPYSFTLKPQESHRLVLNGSCPTTYVGGEKAYYMDVSTADASCRPPGALPSGSYHNSCSSCRIENCNWLVCECDDRTASADLRQCPQNNYCNNRGRLQCGEC